MKEHDTSPNCLDTSLRRRRWRPSGRRRAGHVLYEGRQKFVFRYAKARERHPFGAGNAIRSTFDFCVHRHIAIRAVNWLYLNRNRVATLSPSARRRSGNMGIATQLGLRDDRAFDKPVGLAYDDSV